MKEGGSQMNTTRVVALSVASFIFAGITGCTRDVPYRDIGFSPKVSAASCAASYKAYDDHDRANPDGDYPKIDDSECWRRSREEHDVYDLLSIEVDDQGWVQGASAQPVSERNNYMDELMAQLEQLFQQQGKGAGLSLVVYVHGWHHSARADDADVHAFRRMLRQIAQMEQNLQYANYPRKRVVGIYVGWRGEATWVPLLRKLTFWDRKNTAQRVAYGSVRELLGRLDTFRESKSVEVGDKIARPVRMHARCAC
jgi:hypothetical protein